MDEKLLKDLMHASAIETRKYNIELLTPLAIHGARKDISFRITSVRGVLRYWWRAVRVEDGMNELRKQESLYFGGTDQSYGGKSPIRFTWDNVQLTSGSFPMLPHRNSKDRQRGPQIQQMISPNQHVSLRSELRKKVKDEKSQGDAFADYIHHVLELFFILGSMGQRSRRGFGAVQWDQHQFIDVAEFFEYLRHLFERIGRKAEVHLQKQYLTLNDLEGERALTRPHLSSVWVGEGHENALEIVKKLGVASHERKDKRSLGGIAPRFASPLWCTVKRIDGLYHPVISELSSQETQRSDNYFNERNQFLNRMGVKTVGGE
ncbi:CRISPR-associated protein Cmr1 [Paenibacillus sp. CF095]|uniref:type III-B CRISPR module RAMP protein Cmr1 n=1 Tax=Paenibacillus sp. CF095 TaxID=1881033 RepID=UPI00088EA5C0|nr:type III-B CRISPR module RAMP protein Cmr1 [Paenibacillus sp. CF095]SDE03646.1 CRISPR-associated protein Cmr1 [Paenibacillus sp. CF095]